MAILIDLNVTMSRFTAKINIHLFFLLILYLLCGHFLAISFVKSDQDNKESSSYFSLFDLWEIIILFNVTEN